jgi:hypothetical protein
VEYNVSGWKAFGITTNGVVVKELLPTKYTFRLTYNAIAVSRAQNIDSNATVGFSTVLCTVRVTKTSGSLLDNAIVTYDAGGWKAFGTAIGGIATKEVLPANVQFRAKYGSVQQSKTQNISTNPLVEITLPIP